MDCKNEVKNFDLLSTFLKKLNCQSVVCELKTLSGFTD